MDIITNGCRPAAATLIAGGLIVALLLSVPFAMAGTPPPEEGELHTAQCIAALEVKADELAKQVKAGQQELRPLLLATLDAGAAFIGSAYLQGRRDEARSQALRSAALQVQKELSDADLVARQSACAQEGARLLSESDFIGRAVISRLVERRMQKVLRD